MEYIFIKDKPDWLGDADRIKRMFYMFHFFILIACVPYLLTPATWEEFLSKKKSSSKTNSQLNKKEHWTIKQLSEYELSLKLIYITSIYQNLRLIISGFSRLAFCLHKSNYSRAKDVVIIRGKKSNYKLTLVSMVDIIHSFSFFLHWWQTHLTYYSLRKRVLQFHVEKWFLFQQLKPLNYLINP